MGCANTKAAGLPTSPSKDAPMDVRDAEVPKMQYLTPPPPTLVINGGDINGDYPSITFSDDNKHCQNGHIEITDVPRRPSQDKSLQEVELLAPPEDDNKDDKEAVQEIVKEDLLPNGHANGVEDEEEVSSLKVEGADEGDQLNQELADEAQPSSSADEQTQSNEEGAGGEDAEESDKIAEGEGEPEDKQEDGEQQESNAAEGQADAAEGTVSDEAGNEGSGAEDANEAKADEEVDKKEEETAEEGTANGGEVKDAES